VTTWGGYSGYLRLGIDLSYSLNSAKSVATVTVAVYAQSQAYGHGFSATLNLSGAVSGSPGYSFSSGYGQTVTTLIWAGTFTRNLTYGATQSHGVGASTSIWNGGTPSVTASITLPARPYDKPSAPSSAAVTRNSDTNFKVAWKNNPSTAGPYSQVLVEKNWRNADGSTTAWYQVASLSGSATSWTDTTVKPNQRYLYRIRARNGSGHSGYTATAGQSTTPAAPTGVVAEKQADGSIVVSFVNAARLTGTGFTVYDNGEQVGTAAAVDVGETQSWTHVDPSTTIAHVYTVTMSETGGLVSAPSAPSNSVQLLAPPAAPSGLTPNGVSLAIEAGTPVLSWKHSPVDTSGQTSAEVRRRASGESSWTTTSITGNTQSLPVSGLDVGTFEWQARTRGAYLPSDEEGFSPWSSVATFTLVNEPAAVIETPADAATIPTSNLTVAWSYYQTQSHAHTSSQVRLLDASGTVIEDKTISGASLEHHLTSTLADTSTYTVQVRVRSSDGVWSPWTSADITVSYSPPLAPDVDTAWDADRGTATVQITNTDVTGQPALSLTRTANGATILTTQ
jgi:hypothetical protein